MASYAEYNEKTEASEVVKAFSGQIKRKTILITGVGPAGIGGAVATEIASQGPALIILASRTLSKIEAVAAQIKASYASVETRALVVDFSSIESVRQAAAKVVAYPESTIDVFIHNAGLMDLRPEHRKSVDGIDEHLAINFVGGFLFTNLILNKIIAAGQITGDARIVIVASSASSISPVRFHDLNLDKTALDVPEEELPNVAFLEMFGISTTAPYIPWVAYGQSKTASILFAVQLADVLKGKGVTVNTLHPGAVRTELQRTTTDKDLGATATMMYWKTLSQGASTTLVAAFDPAMKEKTGAYLEDCQIKDAMPYATDLTIAKRLWKIGEDIVGVDACLVYLLDMTENLPNAALEDFEILATPHVLESLIDTYFSCVHNQPYSFFHEQSFRQRLANGVLPDYLKFAVLATALQFSENPYYNGARHEASTSYARKSWKQIVSVWFAPETDPDINICQAITLLSIIDFTGKPPVHFNFHFADSSVSLAGRRHPRWLNIGLSIRIAQDLRLMMEPDFNLPYPNQEERRRVFWSIYILDRFCSCGRGKPAAVADVHCRL
ncbi:hypothetical protein B7463_g7455, partial [Scytalidium lignicola]